MVGHGDDRSCGGHVCWNRSARRLIMKSLSQVIQEAINQHIKWNKSFNSVDEFVDLFLSEYGVLYTAVSEDGFKRQGCHGGPCACTGWCKLAIEASEMDVLSNLNYVVMRKLIYDNLRLTTGLVQIIRS